MVSLRCPLLRLVEKEFPKQKREKKYKDVTVGMALGSVENPSSTSSVVLFIDEVGRKLVVHQLFKNIFGVVPKEKKLLLKLYAPRINVHIIPGPKDSSEEFLYTLMMVKNFNLAHCRDSLPLLETIQNKGSSKDTPKKRKNQYDQNAKGKRPRLQITSSTQPSQRSFQMTLTARNNSLTLSRSSNPTLKPTSRRKELFDKIDEYTSLYAPVKRYTPTVNKPSQSSLSQSSILKFVTDSRTHYSSFKLNGIRNIGNTCYISSVLQSVLVLKTFIEDLFIEQLKGVTEEQCPLYRALISIVNENAARDDVKNPDKIKAAISKSFKQFEGYAQQDAHEFLNILLSLLADELAPVLKDSIQDEDTLSDDNEPDTTIPSWDCPTYKNFDFVLNRHITCMNCKSTSTGGEMYRDISLEIPDSVANQAQKLSVQTLLENEFKEIEVERTCDDCECKQATLIRTIRFLPRILIVHLKRFKQVGNSFEKSKQSVIPNKELNLAFCCTHETEPPQPYVSKDITRTLFTASDANNSPMKKKMDVFSFSDSQSSPDEQLRLALEQSKQVYEEEQEKQRHFQKEQEDMERAIALSLQDLGQANNLEDTEQLVLLSQDDIDRLPLKGEDGQLPNAVYHLQCIIGHSGEINHGHYITFAYNAQAKVWKKHDDSLTTEDVTNIVTPTKTVGGHIDWNTVLTVTNKNCIPFQGNMFKSEIPTPDLSHFRQSDWNDVYEPSEDTFLFLDAIQKDVESIRSLKPSVCLEIGSGSGCVITFLGTILGPKVLYLATDINQKATIATAATGRANKVEIEVVQTDLVNGMLERLRGKVDVLLHNPPYVPTEPDEFARSIKLEKTKLKLENEEIEVIRGGTIEAAWAGGVDGREVIDRLLPIVKDLLSEKGIFYMVAIEENKPKAIMKEMEKKGFCAAIVLKRRAGNETLYILKFNSNSG